jgi:hypothetical protein
MTQCLSTVQQVTRNVKRWREGDDGKERRRGSPRPSARVHHLTPGVQKLVTAKK